MRANRMELDPSAFGLAAGIVTAALFSLCTLAVALAPGFTSAAFSYMLHVNLTGISRPVTWGGYFGGVMCLSLVVGAAFGAAGALYNRFIRGVREAIASEITHRAA